MYLDFLIGSKFNEYILRISQRLTAFFFQIKGCENKIQKRLKFKIIFDDFVSTIIH